MLRERVLDQIERRLTSVAFSAAVAADAGDDEPVAGDAEIVLSRHGIAKIGERFAAEFDQLVANLAVQMVMLRITVVVLVNGPAAERHLSQQACFDELFQRAVKRRPADLLSLVSDGERLDQLIGVEMVVPLEDEFDGDYLWKITRRRSVAIKQLIMNSRLVVGVGNIYASEALYRARVRPRRQARKLSRAECMKLARAIKATLAMAVKVGGTTLRDYVGADGNPGYFRQKLFVYERAGKPCRVCGNPVKQFTQGGRSTYWCSTCQK